MTPGGGKKKSQDRYAQMRPQMHDARIRRDQGVEALHSLNQAGPVGFAAQVFNLFLNFCGQQTQKLSRGGLLRRRAQ